MDLHYQALGLSLNSISYWAGATEPLGLGFLICKMGTKVPSHRVVRIKSEFNPPTQILGFL